MPLLKDIQTGNTQDWCALMFGNWLVDDEIVSARRENHAALTTTCGCYPISGLVL